MHQQWPHANLQQLWCSLFIFCRHRKLWNVSTRSTGQSKSEHTYVIIMLIQQHSNCVFVSSYVHTLSFELPWALVSLKKWYTKRRMTATWHQHTWIVFRPSARSEMTFSRTRDSKKRMYVSNSAYRPSFRVQKARLVTNENFKVCMDGKFERSGRVYPEVQSAKRKWSGLLLQILKKTDRRAPE